MKEKIKNRLKRLERKKAKPNTLDSLVESWIDAGKSYDDLSDDEKNQYCCYKKYDRKAHETLLAAYARLCFEETGEKPTFALEINGPPLTPEEAQRNIDEAFRKAKELFEEESRNDEL